MRAAVTLTGEMKQQKGFEYLAKSESRTRYFLSSVLSYTDPIQSPSDRHKTRPDQARHGKADILVLSLLLIELRFASATVLLLGAELLAN